MTAKIGSRVAVAGGAEQMAVEALCIDAADGKSVLQTMYGNCSSAFKI